jgi:hypothetical protein
VYDQLPTLAIVPRGGKVELAGPTNSASFTSQSTTDLISPVVWTPVSSGPCFVNGQYVVTNAVSGTDMFYRLSL